MDEVEDFKSEVNETEEPKEETKPDDVKIYLIHSFTRFFYKNYVYKNIQADIGSEVKNI